MSSLGKAVTVANSVADFSGIQGHLGWNYGYEVDPTTLGYTLAGYQLMTNFDPTNPDTYGASKTGLWSVSPAVAQVWTALTPSGGHGNGTITTGDRLPVEQWAVRRWVSDVQGPVTVSGQYGDTYFGGNGSHARVYLNGTPIWDQRILDGTPSTDYSFTTTLAVGSVLDFAIDPEAFDDRGDTTLFNAHIDVNLLAGDTNFDGTVNFSDLLTLAKNYNAPGTEHIWGEGDFDHSGTINFTDLLALAKNYGQSLPTGSIPGASATFAADWARAQSLLPEPTTTIGCALLVVSHRRRR